MGFRNLINDGSANPPRLRVQVDLGSVSGKSLAQRLDRVVSGGFGGVEAVCSSPAEAEELAALRRERQLALGICAIGAEADDLLPTIEIAHRAGAEYLSVCVSGSLRASPDIADILKDMYDLTNDAGLVLMVQTRRGSVTQDLRRTIKVLRRYKKVRLSADFSEYVIAARLSDTWPEQICGAFEEVGMRSSAFRAGEQNISGESGEQYRSIWTKAFAAWIQNAREGDVLPFTVTDGDEGLAIRRIAEEAWAAAQTASVQEPAAVGVMAGQSSE